jgi:GNAT superfamily N-acetyltransferase
MLHPTRVLTLQLRSWEASPFSFSIRELPLDQWMGVFSEISGSLIEKQPAHAEILRAIINPCLPAALEIDGKWAACGLGVLEREWLGLFDIFTRPDHRRQGYATGLINGMLVWAREQGAQRSYLQVMEDNVPALNLYFKLGYVDAYGYWYRVPRDF